MRIKIYERNNIYIYIYIIFIFILLRINRVRARTTRIMYILLLLLEYAYYVLDSSTRVRRVVHYGYLEYSYSSSDNIHKKLPCFY